MMEQIVRKLESDEAPRIPGDTANRREFVLEVQAETIDRQQKRAVVRGTHGSSFEIYCDEGTYLGGADTAPPPLSYFSAGIAF